MTTIDPIEQEGKVVWKGGPWDEIVLKRDPSDPDRPICVLITDGTGFGWLLKDEAEAIVGILTDAYGLDPRNESSVDWNETILGLSAKHDEQVSFRYRDAHGNPGIQTRSVKPSDVVTTKRGDKLVIGYDPERDDVRTFRLDRIVGKVRLDG